MSNWQTPTAETYLGLDRAFNHFNEALFENRLPPVVFTLTRKRSAHGYFWAEQFQHRADGDRTHEIALNPNTMSRDLVTILSTLVHEMTHLEQQEYGKPGKNGNHNREWVGLMERVGLTPVGRDGKKTGRNVSHEIDPDGDFLSAANTLVDQGFDLPYFTQPRAASEAKKKDLSKVKHTCPHCDAKAWAKAGSNLMCGDCAEPLVGEV